MICKNCGKELSEGTKYCGGCGTSTEASKTLRTCPKCGIRTTYDQMYCENCGTLLEEDKVSHNSRGAFVREFKLYSYYEGQPTVGISKSMGTLRLYDNRVEYEKSFGNAASSMFGLAGLAVGRKSAKKDPIVNYYYNDIADVKVGKYAGVYNTLVIVMKTGRSFSFCPPVPVSNQPAEIVDLIKLYLN